MIKLLHILSVVVVMSACQVTQSVRSADKEMYSEDLAKVRPEYQMPEDTLRSESVNTSTESPVVVPSADDTYRLNDVLDRTDAFRKNINAIDGYTIQVYSGTDREGARKIRGQLISMLPDEEAELYYDEPNFKVKVGAYYTRLEAQKSFSLVHEEFPSAIIIPVKIPIEKEE